MKGIRKTGEKNEETRNDAKDTLGRIYNVNLFRTTTQHIFKSYHSCDFKVEVVINNTFGMVIIDTEDKVRVCSLQEARK